MIRLIISNIELEYLLNNLSCFCACCVMWLVPVGFQTSRGSLHWIDASVGFEAGMQEFVQQLDGGKKHTWFLTLGIKTNKTKYCITGFVINTIHITLKARLQSCPLPHQVAAEWSSRRCSHCHGSGAKNGSAAEKFSKVQQLDLGIFGPFEINTYVFSSIFVFWCLFWAFWMVSVMLVKPEATVCSTMRSKP